MCVQRESYFKELIHVMAEARQPKISRVGWWAGDAERPSKHRLLQNSLFPRGVGGLVNLFSLKAFN